MISKIKIDSDVAVTIVFENDSFAVKMGFFFENWGSKPAIIEH